MLWGCSVNSMLYLTRVKVVSKVKNQIIKACRFPGNEALHMLGGSHDLKHFTKVVGFLK